MRSVCSANQNLLPIKWPKAFKHTENKWKHWRNSSVPVLTAMGRNFLFLQSRLKLLTINVYSIFFKPPWLSILETTNKFMHSKISKLCMYKFILFNYFKAKFWKLSYSNIYYNIILALFVIFINYYG